MPKDRENTRSLEAHFRTIMQLVIVGLLAWNFTTLQEMSLTVARQEERIAALTKTLELMTSANDDRYRGAEARRDFASVYRRIEQMEKRVSRIEGR